MDFSGITTHVLYQIQGAVNGPSQIKPNSIGWYLDGQGNTIVVGNASSTVQGEVDMQILLQGVTGPINPAQVIPDSPPSGPDATASDPALQMPAGSSSSEVANLVEVQGTLPIDTSFVGTLEGLGGENRIDLTDVAFGANTTLGYSDNNNGSGGTLTVSDGASMATLALLGQYIASSFAMESDGNSGTVVSASVPDNSNLLTQPQHA
jgi:hypothetical protein